MNFKITKTFIIVCLFLNLNFIQAQNNLTIEQQKADFFLFEQALKEAHPGLYRYHSEEQMDSLFAQTESLMDHEMNQQEFYQLLLPVVGQIKCGHTKLHPDINLAYNYYYNTEKLFPLKLHFVEDKAFVIDSYSGNTSVPPGSEIVSIQGKPVSEIIAHTLPSFFSDGNNTTFKYVEMDHYFSASYANLFEGPDTFDVKYKNSGKVEDIKISSISYKTIESYETQQAENKNHQPPFRLEFQNNETAVLTISSFWEGSNHEYKKFLANSFKTINQKQIQNLVIDLRGNEGGVDKRGSLLLSYIMDREFRYYEKLEVTTRKKYSFAKQAHLPRFYGIYRHLISKEKDGTYQWNHNKNLKIQKPQKNHFSGNVYVLINGASFSVTAEFAAVADNLERATFIGEETGGAYYGNNSGTFVVVTLPNSKLNIGIPMIAYYTAVRGYPFPDRGVIPDYEVSPGIQDILSGKDPAMDFALKLTSGNDQ